MAKLTRPFGRQIANMKASAIEAVGGKGDVAELVTTANHIAKENGYDYTFTPDSFAKSKKASKPKGKGKAATSPKPVAQTGGAVDDVVTLVELVKRMGAENVARTVERLKDVM